MKNIINNLIAILLLILTSCTSGSNGNDKLKLVSSVKLEVPEPSGLALDGNSFWCVSDETSRVYNLDSTGKVIVSFIIDGIDLEGISVINDSLLAVVCERQRELIIVSKTGRQKNKISTGIKGELNKGFEGVCFNSRKNMFVILNEKKPASVFMLKDQKIIFQKELNFANDLSGIDFDADNNQYWIVSDESQSVFLCDSSFNVIWKAKLNIKQLEGIAFDKDNNSLFLISDPLEHLYQYRIVK